MGWVDLCPAHCQVIVQAADHNISLFHLQSPFNSAPALSATSSTQSYHYTRPETPPKAPLRHADRSAQSPNQYFLITTTMPDSYTDSAQGDIGHGTSSGFPSLANDTLAGGSSKITCGTYVRFVEPNLTCYGLELPIGSQVSVSAIEGNPDYESPNFNDIAASECDFLYERGCKDGKPGKRTYQPPSIGVEHTQCPSMFVIDRPGKDRLELPFPPETKVETFQTEYTPKEGTRFDPNAFGVRGEFDPPYKRDVSDNKSVPSEANSAVSVGTHTFLVATGNLYSTTRSTTGRDSRSSLPNTCGCTQRTEKIGRGVISITVNSSGQYEVSSQALEPRRPDETTSILPFSNFQIFADGSDHVWLKHSDGVSEASGSGACHDCNPGRVLMASVRRDQVGELIR